MLHSAHWILNTVCYTLYAANWVLHTVCCMLNFAYCMLYGGCCTPYVVYCILYSVCFPLYTEHCMPLITVFFTLYAAHCILNTVLCKQYADLLNFPNFTQKWFQVWKNLRQKVCKFCQTARANCMSTFTLFLSKIYSPPLFRTFGHIAIGSAGPKV